MASLVDEDGVQLESLRFQTIDPVRLRNAIAAYLGGRCGWSMREVGRIFGLTMVRTDSALFVDLGIAHTDPADYRVTQREIARKLWGLGWSTRRIARLLGCSKSEAHRIYRGERCPINKKSDVNSFEDEDLQG